jgi:hypothetical protein
MGLLDIGKKLVDPLGLVFDDKKTAKLPQGTDIFKVNKKTGLNLVGTQVKGVEGFYDQALPSTMRTMDKYGGAFMDQGFRFGQQGVTGFQGLRDLATGGEADAMARLREAELGTMTDQAGMTRGLMESLSPEQAAQVKNMQDLASQAAGAEGAYAGRMGEALGVYGIRPQTFNPTIQAAEQDAAMANQMAQEAYARRGTLSAQEQRLAQQTAREAAQSAGRLGGNAAIAAEIQNREAALAGRRAQASQAGQQAFDQRQNLANLRFQEQQALFNQRITGATTTADMQQAGLEQLQDIERMRAGLRGTAGEEAMRAYGAAGGFYTTPGLNLLNQTPQSYTAGTNMANIGLNLGQTMTPSLDPNLGLNLALTKSGQMDARSLAQYQMDMQAKVARDKMIGDMIGTIGSAAMTASDRRLKTDIQRVGTTDGGLPIYTYKYKGESMTQMGVMAQDVEKVNPEAVREFGGYKAVNYALVK